MRHPLFSPSGIRGCVPERSGQIKRAAKKQPIRKWSKESVHQMSENVKLFFPGLFLFALFGSALDSQGWAGWVAVVGTLIGLALIWTGGKA